MSPSFIDQPGVVQLINAGPLTTESLSHFEVLDAELQGDVLVVHHPESSLPSLCQRLSLDSLTLRENGASTADEIKQYDLNLPDGAQFDTVLYHKERANPLLRAKDFHRLTPRLRTRGRLLSKTKWLPQSKRLSFDDLLIAEPFGFEDPHIYLRYTKPQSSLGDFAATSKPVPENNTGDSERNESVAPYSTDIIRSLTSQFAFDSIQTAFQDGWSWKKAVQSWVAERLSGFETTANLCSGSASLGDLRFDIARSNTGGHNRESDATNVLADARQAPLTDNSVDATVMDPPWKIPPAQRVQFYSEAVRITRPGGRVIHNSWWLPYHPYTELQTVRIATANVFDGFQGPGGISLLGVYEVCPTPDFGPHSYELSTHVEQCGLDHLHAFARNEMQVDCPRPQDNPLFDPRIVYPSPLTCRVCEHSRLSPVFPVSGPLFECRQCGFRHTPHDVFSTDMITSVQTPPQSAR